MQETITGPGGTAGETAGRIDHSLQSREKLEGPNTGNEMIAATTQKPQEGFPFHLTDARSDMRISMHPGVRCARYTPNPELAPVVAAKSRSQY